MDFFKVLDFSLVVTLVTQLHPTRVDAGSVIYRRGDKAEESKSM